MSVRSSRACSAFSKKQDNKSHLLRADCSNAATAVLCVWTSCPQQNGGSLYGTIVCINWGSDVVLRVWYLAVGAYHGKARISKSTLWQKVTTVTVILPTTTTPVYVGILILVWCSSVKDEKETVTTLSQFPLYIAACSWLWKCILQSLRPIGV